MRTAKATLVDDEINRSEYSVVDAYVSSHRASVARERHSNFGQQLSDAATRRL